MVETVFITELICWQKERKKKKPPCSGGPIHDC